MTSRFQIYLAFLFVLSISISKAEIKGKIYYEPIENGYKIYADNS